ncbi:hypothetical protein RhiTH_010050 [Rhizoctonia solani]
MQSISTSGYVRDFTVVANKLEWSDNALISTFHQELRAEVRNKWVKFTLRKNISFLDKCISTDFLSRDKLFKACKVLIGETLATMTIHLHNQNRIKNKIMFPEESRKPEEVLENVQSVERRYAKGKTA